MLNFLLFQAPGILTESPPVYIHKSCLNGLAIPSENSLTVLLFKLYVFD